VTLDQRGWDTLLRQIQRGHCTPVIGAGASATIVPGAATLAQSWADEYGYPLADKHDLARVSQYIALTDYPARPKEMMLDELEKVGDVDLSGTPYPYLAQLPFPLYITTNYDDLISRALRPAKAPAVDYCRWNDYESIEERVPAGRTHQPTIAQPLVYHLHGQAQWIESLVLTEEDYLDFLISAAENSQHQSQFLRPDIRAALAGSSLLFIGYRLSDWTFRVLFRGLMRSIRANTQKPAVAIQLVPGANEVASGKLAEAQAYLQRYLTQLHRVPTLAMYWGDATQFARELLERYEEYVRGGD
jgi:SIR2-like domain